MAVKQPPVALQNVLLPAEDLRRFISSVMGHRSGVVGLNDLTVSQMGTPGMGVDIATGSAFIYGAETTYQGMYWGENRGSISLVIDAADLTNPRVDLVVIRVKDSVYSGVLDSLNLEVIKGTPAGSPVEPTVTGSYIILARVDVAANATSITNAVITDRRTLGPQGRASALGGVRVCVSTNLPTTGLYEGMLVYCTDLNLMFVYDGTTWRGVGYAAQLPSQIHYGSISNGGSGNLITANSIGTAPYPLRMHVEVSGDAGGNSAAATTIGFTMTDGGGTSILHGPVGSNGIAISAGQVQFQMWNGDTRIPWFMYGYKDYTAGQVMGIRVAMTVGTGNAYVGAMAKVTFEPR